MSCHCKLQCPTQRNIDYYFQLGILENLIDQLIFYFSMFVFQFRSNLIQVRFFNSLGVQYPLHSVQKHFAMENVYMEMSHSAKNKI